MNLIHQILLQYDEIDVNIQDKYGYTALHWAVINNQTENVKALLDYGADIGIKSKKGDTASDKAKEKYYVENKEY